MLIIISNTSFIQNKYEYFTNADTGEVMVLDKETGEAVPTTTIIAPVGTLFYTPAQQQAYKEMKKKQADIYYKRTDKSLLPLGNYYFVSSVERFNELSPETVTRLMYLSTFIRYNSNRLMLTERKAIRRKDLINVLGISESSVRRFWNEVSPDYLKEDSSGLIVINADIFRRGKLTKHINNPYMKMYINGVRKLYQAANSKYHKQLGYLFKLLPFINVEYNILCANPLEKNIDMVEPITISYFCELTGYDLSHINRLINIYNKVRFDVAGRQERFCSFVYDGIDRSKAKIIINPNILYSGSDYNAVKVLGAFHK